MGKTIKDLKTQFKKDIEILKRTQAEMKIEWEKCNTHLENSKENLTSRRGQVEESFQDSKIA